MKVKKIYQNLNDAFGRATAVYGPYEEWCSGLNENNCRKRVFERVTEFMKVSKVCTINDNCSISYDTNEGISGTAGNYSLGYNVILADGSTVGFVPRYKSADIFVDIDGSNKGKNSYCTDTFRFKFMYNELNVANPYNYGSNLTTYSPYKYPMECTYWVITQGNMDYTKTGDDGKCPDGQKLSETHTTCK